MIPISLVLMATVAKVDPTIDPLFFRKSHIWREKHNFPSLTLSIIMSGSDSAISIPKSARSRQFIDARAAWFSQSVWCSFFMCRYPYFSLPHVRSVVPLETDRPGMTNFVRGKDLTTLASLSRIPQAAQTSAGAGFDSISTSAERNTIRARGRSVVVLFMITFRG